MIKIDQTILDDAENFAGDLLSVLPEEMTYHTIEHTKSVVKAVELIGLQSGLNEDELYTAKVCAWFHDVGYLESPADHEEESAKAAEDFLKTHNVDEDEISIVKEAIFATRLPQSPQNVIAKVLCDADMHHLSAPAFFETTEQLRLEKKWLSGSKIPKHEFNKTSAKLFSEHSYFTDYGKTVLQKRKELNFSMLEEKIEKRKKKSANQSAGLSTEKNILPKKPEKPKGYSRGVESMFRLTARNQISLSAIADNKSNILISVNTIIISIILTVLVSSFAEFPALILPSLIFLAVSLVTIIFAILSTRPNISSGRFKKEDIQQKKVNLLFFGNFYDMSLEDYDWAIKEMMKEDDYLYATMIKDQHSLGIVLAKKYKLLRKAYNIFMFGLIISVVAYILAFVNI
jgi:predicted metal-dependent HD superfamily phosphohydrolase